uniref:F-box domain-containing protein n=1 Tax=Araucaria cunninghamii TaxID=56994 RepID=A0A0D6RAW1_ARACU
MALVQAQSQVDLRTEAGESRWLVMREAACRSRSSRSLRYMDGSMSCARATAYAEAEAEGSSLIPGLPDDVAYECLLRAPLGCHHNMARVSRQWSRVVKGEKFYSERAEKGVADEWICALVRDQRYTNSVRVFDTRAKSWRSLPPMPDNRHRRAVGQECRAVGGKIVVCGGWRDFPLDDVTVFDPALNRWFSGPPMLSPRAHFVSGVIGGRLYVAGGGDGKQPRSQRAECFDPALNRWFPIPSLDIAISFCLGVAMAGKLFVQARGGEPRGTQVFLPDFGLWSLFNSQMLSWPHRPHAVLGDDKLYRADVNGGKHELMAYDAEKDQWTSLGLIVNGPRRRIHELVAVDNRLWAVADDFSVGLIRLDVPTNCPTPRFVNCVGPSESPERLISCHVMAR